MAAGAARRVAAVRPSPMLPTSAARMPPRTGSLSMDLLLLAACALTALVAVLTTIWIVPLAVVAALAAAADEPA
jgi:hypothetical protein